jgi:hypothetical protein
LFTTDRLRRAIHTDGTVKMLGDLVRVEIVNLNEFRRPTSSAGEGD